MALIWKSIHFSNILLIILSLWACRAASRTLNEASMLERYEQWMVQYGRVYNDATEKEACFEIFKENVKRIESLNMAGNRTYMLSVNGFADTKPMKSSRQLEMDTKDFAHQQNLYMPLLSDTKMPLQFPLVWTGGRKVQ
ncbi:hypothetical protein IFM89_014057 [Coptis chinensis]|uniref:Cathepsin propeptide inhibitor domain-containing protein n=1 Tax=Coptis chinensis TaxID=261450 RepID=A0A835HKD2_9MAGN|nr:hypothetical protein IFM89_014057 [Coptis chinensis]